MRILAIDPGSSQSAYVILEHTTMKVVARSILANQEILHGFMGDPETFFSHYYDAVVIEYPKARGQMVFNQLIDTVYWIGRFDQACSYDMIRMDRKDVKMALCETVFRISDANIRAACIARFEYQVKGKPGKCPVVGTVSLRGPLYGITKDMWSALAVALTYSDGLGTKNMLGYGEKGATTKRRTSRSIHNNSLK